MSRLRLQSQLLLSTLLIICALTGAILLILQHTVRKQIADQVQSSTQASFREFETVQRELQLQLSRTASLLAEIPTLKALMTTHDAPTIQDGSTPFWRLAGSDLFLLADPEGRVVALDVTQKGVDQESAEKNLKTSLQAGQESAWWYSGGRLYWIFLRPILAGTGADAKVLGLVAIGYETNSRIAEQLGFVAESKIVLLADHRIIASTFSPEQEAILQKGFLAGKTLPEAATAEVTLGDDSYRVARV